MPNKADFRHKMKFFLRNAKFDNKFVAKKLDKIYNAKFDNKFVAKSLKGKTVQ
jgi:hypothetical protein